jgi:hypothetical protein
MTMKILDRIRNWVREARAQHALDSITRAYRKAGHPAPAVAAANEVWLRAYLEDFRREASAKHAEDPEANLYTMKQDFIARYCPKARIEMGYKEAIALKKTIEAMPYDEALYPDVYAACWKAWKERAKKSTAKRPQAHEDVLLGISRRKTP